MAKSIQFQGRDNLIEGFKNTKAMGWSVWDGRDMLTKGIGPEMLETFLSALEEGSTNTIYTLKIYEDIDDAKKIKMSTDPDGSFKFLLCGDPEEITHPIYSRGNNSNKLFQRLQMLEETQTKIVETLAVISGTDEDDEEDEPQTIGAAFVDMIKNPAKLKEFAESAAMVKSLLFSPPGNLAVLPATIGHLNTEPMTEEQKVLRAQAAINTLEKNDPKLVEHLETLAALSESDKTQFDFLCSMLDKMKK